MNITITVDEITLNTVVGDIVEYDEDGDANVVGHKTVADLVADRIVERLVRDTDRWPSLRERVIQIRNEEIRAQVRPSIEAALTRPIRKTNTYGEPVGPETTLSELISEETRKYISEPADKYRTEKGTVLQAAVRAEVKAAVAEQVAAAVAGFKGELLAEVRTVAEAELAKALNS
ncbi:hypothetical protein ACWEO1_22755 [Kitasatospora cineracea]